MVSQPDGNCGGEYASRGTKFFFPAGFEMLSAVDDNSSIIAKSGKNFTNNNKGINFNQMDVWNQFPLLNNYLFAAENSHISYSSSSLPWNSKSGNEIFEEAGLAVMYARNRVCYLNFKMGGIFKILDKSGLLIYEDCGYAIKSKKRIISSQSLSQYKIDYLKNGSVKFNIKCNFSSISSPRFDPVKFLLFRLFMIIFGRFLLLHA